MRKKEKQPTEYGLLNATDLKETKNKLVYGVMYALIILIAIICVLPVIWISLTGFKEVKEIYSIPPKLLPSRIDLSKIPKVLSVVHFGKYLGNTLIMMVGCLAFDVIFNGMAGYVLARVKPKGYKILDTAIFWSMMLPGMGMVPLYMSFADVPIIHVSLLGSYLPLWIMAGTGPFNIFLFKNFFNSIDPAYLEAAKLDGCSNLSAFFRIILPLSKPILTVVAIFSIINSWGNFFWPYLVLSKNNWTISVMLYQLSNVSNVLQINDLMLLLTIAALPTIIIYCIFSRHINGGVDMSGMKG